MFGLWSCRLRGLTVVAALAGAFAQASSPEESCPQLLLISSQFLIGGEKPIERVELIQNLQLRSNYAEEPWINTVDDPTDIYGVKMDTSGTRLAIVYHTPSFTEEGPGTDFVVGVVDLELLSLRRRFHHFNDAYPSPGYSPLGPNYVALSPDGKQVRAIYNNIDLEGDVLEYYIRDLDVEADHGWRAVEVQDPSGRKPMIFDPWGFSPSGRYVLFIDVTESYTESHLYSRSCYHEVPDEELIRQSRAIRRHASRFVYLFDAESGRALGDPIEILGAISRVDFSPGDQRIAVADEAGRVVVWSSGDKKSEPAVLRGAGPIADMSFSNDGQTMLVVRAGNEGKVTVVNLGDRDSWDFQTSYGEIKSARFSPNIPSRVAITTASELLVFDLNDVDASPEMIVRGGLGEDSVEFGEPVWSPNGKWIFTSLLSGTTVIAWDPKTGRPDFELKLAESGKNRGPVSATPNGDTVVQLTQYADLRVWKEEQLEAAVRAADQRGARRRTLAAGDRILIEWDDPPGRDSNSLITTIRWNEQ